MALFNHLKQMSAGPDHADTPASARWMQVAFATLLGLSIVFFFVEIDRSSLWVDELYTLYVVSPRDAISVAERIADDVHPPLYYTLAWLWTHLAGVSGPALRVLSGLCMAGSLLILVAWGPFSLKARLFAAALAATSPYVFYQSQNARSYGLALLLITALAVMLLRLLEDRPPSRRLLAGVAAVGLLASLVHPYAFLVSLSGLGFAFLLRPNALRWLVPIMFGIGLAYTAWQFLVIVPFTDSSLTDSWIPGTWSWTISKTKDAAKGVLGFYGMLAAIICLPGLYFAWISRGEARRQAMVCILTPVGVWLFAVAISLITPSIIDRNLLIASPFVWCLAALMFDFMDDNAAQWTRWLTLATVPLAVLSTTVISARFRPQNEPYKETFKVYSEQLACKDNKLSVLMSGTATDPNKYIISYYYTGSQGVQLVDIDELSDDRVRADVRDQIAAMTAGCRTIAVAVHGFSPQRSVIVAQALSDIARPMGYQVVAREVATAEAVRLGDYIFLDHVIRTGSWRTHGYLFDLVPVADRSGATDRHERPQGLSDRHAQQLQPG